MGNRLDQFGVGDVENNVMGPDIASSATISVTHKYHRITGTAAISTINPPWPLFIGEIVLIPAAAFTLSTDNNIANAFTAVTDKAIVLHYNGTKWYVVLGDVTSSSGNVTLQSSTPGTAQTGNLNVTGTAKAAAFAGNLTGDVTGNSSGTHTGSVTGATTVSTTSVVMPDSTGAPVDATAQTLVAASAGGNNDLTLTAKVLGIQSPPVTLTRVVGGTTAALSILTTGQNIVVTLANTDGTPTSTANDVKGIIDGDGPSAALVTVAVEGNGTGVVDANVSQPLTGGVNGTVGTKNQLISYNGVLYHCNANATAATAGAWKKVTLEGL